MMDNILQVVSVAGAVLVLGAFLALQRGWWAGHGRGYLWSNFVGAALLVLVASLDGRIGFILLEGAWAAVALLSIIRGPGPTQRRQEPRVSRVYIAPQ